MLNKTEEELIIEIREVFNQIKRTSSSYRKKDLKKYLKKLNKQLLILRKNLKL